MAAAAVQAAAEDDTVGPIFLREPPNRVDFSNSTGAVVECKARGNPPPEIIWVRSDGTAVGDVPGLRQILANGNLVFPPFRAEDYRQEVHAQVYSCLAKNQVGTIHSRDVNVRAGRLIEFYLYCFDLVWWDIWDKLNRFFFNRPDKKNGLTQQRIEWFIRRKRTGHISYCPNFFQFFPICRIYVIFPKKKLKFNLICYFKDISIFLDFLNFWLNRYWINVNGRNIF